MNNDQPFAHTTPPDAPRQEGTLPTETAAALDAAASRARDALADLRYAHDYRRKYDHADADPGPTSHLAAHLAQDAHVSQGQALANLRSAVTSGRKAVDLEAETTESETVTRLLDIEPPAGTGPIADARLLQAVGAVLDPPAPQPPPSVTVREVTGDPPAPVLAKVGLDGRRDGAILTAGNVGILAGAGGAAKSTLALQIALQAAATTEGAYGELADGLLSVRGGPVLMAVYEDSLPWLRDLALRMVELEPETDPGLDRLHFRDLSGWPLYEPPDGLGFNARPVPGPGWEPLWQNIAAVGARLVVIDPALAAFTGESNAAGPVRAFIGALAVEASNRGVGVLLVAHSSKAARKDGDPYDPGQVGGSSHWVDGSRGAMSLSRVGGDVHRLAIVKSNYGPAYEYVDMRMNRSRSGAIAGLSPADEWRSGHPEKKPKAAAATRNGTNDVHQDDSEV